MKNEVKCKQNGQLQHLSVAFIVSIFVDGNVDAQNGRLKAEAGPAEASAIVGHERRNLLRTIPYAYLVNRFSPCLWVVDIDTMSLQFVCPSHVWLVGPPASLKSLLTTISKQNVSKPSPFKESG